MRIRLIGIATWIVITAAWEFSQAAVPLVAVDWDGSAGINPAHGTARWEDANWTKSGIAGLTAIAAMGDVNGGRGGMAISIGHGASVDFDENTWLYDGLGDFKPRMDWYGPGSLTLKEGATLFMDSHSDADGRWSRVSMDFAIDNALWRRTHSGASQSGGKIIFGYHNDLLANQKINISLVNGGRIENDGKMIFGEFDLAPDMGHNKGIEVAMTINGGTLDLSGGANFPDYFGLAEGELLFFYEYDVNNHVPANEKYSINFTGPGKVIVDNGIFVGAKDPSGTLNPLGGAPDFVTPISYESLWNLGILQANGQSGLTGAGFRNYFTTVGTKSAANYTLISLVVPEPTCLVLILLPIGINSSSLRVPRCRSRST